MKRQVIGNKSRNEIVTVVVLRVPTQSERLPHFCACTLQQFRSQLLLCQEIVIQTLIDQYALRESRTAFS